MYVAGGEDGRTRSNLTLKMTRRPLAVASSFFSPIFRWVNTLFSSFSQSNDFLSRSLTLDLHACCSRCICDFSFLPVFCLTIVMAPANPSEPRSRRGVKTERVFSEMMSVASHSQLHTWPALHTSPPGSTSLVGGGGALAFCSICLWGNEIEEVGRGDSLHRWSFGLPGKCAHR